MTPQRGASAMQVTTVGLDLAKRIFQVHGVDAAGKVVIRRRLQRSEIAAFFADLPACLVGIEACATAHHWARLIGASGHQVRLIPPSYVKPYVRRSKTDAADAEAICDAVGRPSMRFVPVKSAHQQAALLHHRARDLLVRQRTMLINAIRGHLGEFGIIAPAGRRRVADLVNLLQGADDAEVPALAREALQSLFAELSALEIRIKVVEAVIMREHRSNAVSRRLLTVGATVVMRRLPGKTDGLSLWVRALLDRRPFRLVSLALANKMARIAWAIMVRSEAYRASA